MLTMVSHAECLRTADQLKRDRKPWRHLLSADAGRGDSLDEAPGMVSMGMNFIASVSTAR